jgi:hypothetical protein
MELITMILKVNISFNILVFVFGVSQDNPVHHVIAHIVVEKILITDIANLTVIILFSTN